MPGAPSAADGELLLASRLLGSGARQNELSVPSIHCGACIARIERLLGELPEVERARANLSTKRVTVAWRGVRPPDLVGVLSQAGYDAYLPDAGHDPALDRGDRTTRELVRALAVAGFAAGNVMMLSMAVWFGAGGEARDIFHWLSAAIALPALAYSGRIFFRSAWQALRHGHTNMDVPVTIGVLLAFGMSLYETVHHGPYAYFDAALSLLFVLLIGRALDHVMRERATTAVTGLARLAARGASVVQPDGSQHYLPVEDIRPGMILALGAGDRVPVDARVVAGRSEIDASQVSGESLPRAVSAGSAIAAGTLTLGGPLTVEATATADDSFLAEMRRMMETAEAGRAGYRRIADRAARLYAPVVHLAALATFAGWMLATGDAHFAITTAIAVLIITCPCALGLAVPMVQVVASQQLFARGVMAKGGGALERLAEADHVVFDKTGTLTSGVPRLVGGGTDSDLLAIAAAMAAASHHPYSRAIAAEGRARGAPTVAFTELDEHAGDGLEGRLGAKVYRLGRPGWALAGEADDDAGVALSADGALLARFAFADELRAGAREAIERLRTDGLSVEIVSGDHEESVRALAASLGLPYRAGVSPAAKVEAMATLAASGRKVLMVGDGINDAPALGAAHASMAAASASDVGRSAADFVFLRDDLRAVPDTMAVARRARALVQQNLMLAAGYNALAIPVAILGLVTPLVAAVAMSVSSLAVVGNALRLRGDR